MVKYKEFMYKKYWLKKDCKSATVWTRVAKKNLITKMKVLQLTEFLLK